MGTTRRYSGGSAWRGKRTFPRSSTAKGVGSYPTAAAVHHVYVINGDMSVKLGWVILKKVRLRFVI